MNVPCIAYINKTSSPETQAVWAYNQTSDTMEVIRECTSENMHKHQNIECCRTVPWPSHVSKGYPYRYDEYGKDYTPHFAWIWPYGGATYALSRGMLAAIGREKWEECMYRLQCGNADHRIMTCVLNSGYSVSQGPLEGYTKHHVHSVKDMIKYAEKLGFKYKNISQG
jgi:hypothetical protein